MSIAIDQNKLLVRCMGNVALVQKLLTALLNSLPTEKKSLEEAFHGEDFGSVARIAHKMRGTASNMCANPLSAAAHQVELAARSNQTELVAQRWLDLNQEIEILINFLSRQASKAL